MKIDENGVHIGRDGWLFLAAGSNEALRLLTDRDLFEADDACKWAAKLSERKKRVGDLGAEYFHMWVPDKIKVYSDKLDFDATLLKVDPPRMVRECTQAFDLGETIVDPSPEFAQFKTERLLYWKTDTHWTYWGACAAYMALCRAIKVGPLGDIWDRPIHYINLALDLGSKLTPPVKEDWGGAQVLR